MTKHTVVIEPCAPETPNEEVSAKVADMLGKLPGIEQRLQEAKRIFVKLNIGIGHSPTYRERPMSCVDWSVFAGLASYLRERTDAQVLVGDGCDGIAPADAARERGHMAIIEESGFQFGEWVGTRDHLGNDPFGVSRKSRLADLGYQAGANGARLSGAAGTHHADEPLAAVQASEEIGNESFATEEVGCICFLECV